MRLHAILLTRNAEDIIEQNLLAALEWADYIYVQDTGSVDGTSARIQSVSARDSRVVTLPPRHIEVFHEGLRADTFNAVRSRAEDGDWFVHLDEDEFFHQDPRLFIQSLNKNETAVWSQLLEFRLTKSEAARLSDVEQLKQERQKSIVERLRYYQALEYSESRLFKYRKTMIWSTHGSFPHNAGFVARKRIAIRHYPHRDPVQLRLRLELRHEMLKKLPRGTYPHWNLKMDELLIEQGTPGLRYWEPGTELDVPAYASHIAPPPKRLVQFLLHKYAVRIVDRLRPRLVEGSGRE